MTEGYLRIIGVAVISAVALHAFLWMSLRIRFYKTIEPERSMKWQAIAHFFQGLAWLSVALFTGEEPLFQVQVSQWATVIFFLAYLASWLIAYIYKEAQLRRILLRRIEVHNHWQKVFTEGENQDATSS